MKLLKRETGKSNENRRIIRRMIIIMLIASIVLVGGFFVIQFQDFAVRSEKSIRSYMETGVFDYEDRSAIYVYELYVGEGVTDYADEAEEKMTAYFMSNRSSFSNNSFYWYINRGICCFFIPLNAVKRGAYMPEGADGMLLYTDVSYDIIALRNNTLLLAAVLAFVCVLLFLVSRYTIRLLDAKDMSLKNFFANASHELKTPLMSIRGNVDGIRNHYVDIEQGCDVIEKETERMSGLISSILEISRLDSGTVKPEMTRNDVREILYDAASSISSTAMQKEIQLEMDLPDPIFRDCDESMLYSAFSNILTNDIRYAQHLIRVYSEKVSEGKTKILFENDGTLISEEARQHIFDRFYKGSQGQSGIGMALAQEYIKLHGSIIRVYVRDDRTVFEIVI